jgi:uracil-DNA glycosylase
MPLNRRQREILGEMGIPVWVRRDARPAFPAPVPQAPTKTPVPVGDGGDVAGMGWEDLRAGVAACVACAELASQRTQTVFGVGDPDADWLFIGEAPGAEEDRRGEPFVGPAGQLLDNMLAALALERGRNVYIANILKCRPPGNRDPKPEEAEACRGFLDRQIALIRPRVIVALGRVAAQNLLGSSEPLGRLRDREHSYRNIPLVVTYHPAYLLRSPGEKAKAWRDLLRARGLVATA